MSKLLLWSLSLFLLSCEGTDTLVRFCPETCFTGNPKQQDIGQCKPGIPICNERNEIVSCNGEILPSIEVCDLLDNNCNGKTDEFLGPWELYYYEFNIKEEFPCNIAGSCRDSKAVCIEGEWVCKYNSSVELEDGYPADTETRCDNKDNNCDGLIDNLYEKATLSDRVCYTGQPTSSVFITPCHPGILDCINGQEICTNQQLPSPEVCNRIDDNCNGAIDDHDNLVDLSVDIVFIPDTSGSMLAEIEAVATACEQYAVQFQDDQKYQFAMVSMSELVPGFVEKLSDFTSFTGIQTELRRLTAMGAATEASLDAMYLTCNQSNQLGLSWRQESLKVVFLFSDEVYQSVLGLTVADVVEECRTTNIRIYTWTQIANGFDTIATETGGQNFTLKNRASELVDDMNTIIEQICLIVE